MPTTKKFRRWAKNSANPLTPDIREVEEHNGVFIELSASRPDSDMWGVSVFEPGDDREFRNFDVTHDTPVEDTLAQSVHDEAEAREYFEDDVRDRIDEILDEAASDKQQDMADWTKDTEGVPGGEVIRWTLEGTDKIVSIEPDSSMLGTAKFKVFRPPIKEGEPDSGRFGAFADDMDEAMEKAERFKEIVEENSGSSSSDGRGKGQYQEFMSERMKELRGQDMDAQKAMKKANEEWQKSKG